MSVQGDKAHAILDAMRGKDAAVACSDAEAIATVEKAADERIMVVQAWEDYIATSNWSAQRKLAFRKGLVL